MDKAEDKDLVTNVSLNVSNINYSTIYNALRSNNTEILSELFLFAESKTKSLLSILTEAYEEAMLKNIPLSPDTRFLVEFKLMDLQYISEVTKQQNDDFTTSFEDIKDHLHFASELINSFLSKYFGNDFETNMEFIVHARYIAQHISVLKRRMNYTYEILPWEEMQFCLVIYLQILINPKKLDIIYKLIISRNRILTHLFHFHSKLKEIEYQFKEEDLIRKRSSNREIIKESILKSSSIFEHLYKDFSLLRNVYSLERINFYVNMALAINFKDNKSMGPLVIERTLQVIGEYIKNTPDSPNLSDDLYKSLLKSAPRNLRSILTNLRNMLSHAFSLNRKLELESSQDPEFFRKIQTDLKKIQIDILYILYKQKIEAIKIFLYRLLDLQDMEDLKFACKHVDIPYVQEVSEYEINLEEFLKVKNLVSLFCEKVSEDSSDHSEQITEIFDSLKAYETQIKKVNFTYVEGLNKVLSLVQSHGCIHNIKSMVRTYLSMLSASEPQSLYDGIFIKLRHIYESFKIKRKFDSENFLNPDEKSLQAANILIEIHNYLKWRLCKIGWIEEMEDRLTLKQEKNEKECKAKEIFQMIQDKLEFQKDKILVANSIKKVQQCHYSKYDLLNSLDEEAEVFRSKVKSLGLSFKRQNEILYNHEHGNKENLLLMIKGIDDVYGNFVNKLADMFPLSKHVNSIKSFYIGLGLKNLQKKIDKAIGDAISNEVKRCFRKRLHTLKICLADITDIKSIRDDEIIIVCLEMLVMDLLELLENVGLLNDNKMMPVDNSPILFGKQLRNHLAHGDILTDILPYDEVLALIFHSDRLVKIGDAILSQKVLFGCKQVKNRGVSFQDSFEKSLKIIKDQIKLFDVARNGSIEEIEEIIKLGADIVGINYNEWTALHFAIYGSNKAMLKYLVKLVGLTKGIKAYQLLELGVSLGNMEIVEFLINEMDLDINYRLRNGSNFLIVALQHSQEHIGERFLQIGTKLDIKESSGKNALHFASENGCLKIVKFFVDKCSEMLDLVTDDNSTPLHLAAKNGHIDVVNVLLDNGANVNLKNRQGLTALHISARYGHVNILEYLLETSGSGLLIEDLIKAFNLATQNGHCTAIKSLLRKRNELNIESNQTNFMLHVASLYGHPNIISELIHNDIDIYSKDTTGRTALHLASQCGHSDVIKLFLNAEIDPNIPDNDGWTALHWATNNRHIDVVTMLLSNQSRVDIGDKNGKTAFHLAAENGDIGILNVLLNFKANAMATTISGQTALHLAANNGYCGIIEILVNTCKVDINTKDHNEETALIIATNKGHNDVVVLLLKYGANTNHKSKKEGFSAISRAAAQGHLNILLKLIKFGADIEIQENSGWRPLHYAAQNGYNDILDVLLKYEVDVNAKYKYGGTALHTAIRNGHIDIVQKLIKHGSDINSMFMTILPLRVAAHFGHHNIVMVLLASQSDVDATGSDKITPLHAASWNGHVDVVKLLIQHGANINAQSEEQWTALHFAAKFGFSEIVQILLENLANVFIENNIGMTAFHLACKMGRKSIVNMLLHVYGMDVNIKSQNCVTGLHMASANGSVELVEMLINHKADVNVRSTDGSIPLHWATQYSGSALLVKILIQYGSEVNVKDIKGATPLHLAVINGNKEVVEELLENNADVNAGNKSVCALHLAVALKHRSIIKTLLRSGAIINSLDFRKRTCLHIASKEGYKDVAEMLLENGAEVNLKDENDMTPLHWAVEKGYADITRWLVKSSANINSLDNKSRTPLYLALEHQYEDIAKILIENNAAVQLKQ